MIPSLTKISYKLYHIVNNNIIEGVHSGITGDVSGITGNVSGIIGDVSGITGNITGIRGDVSGITGDVTGIYGNVSRIHGNVDNCNITQNERDNGIIINEIIKTEPVKQKITLELTQEQIDKIQKILS